MGVGHQISEPLMKQVSRIDALSEFVVGSYTDAGKPTMNVNIAFIVATKAVGSPNN